MNLWKEHIGNTDRPGNFIIEDKGNLGTKLTYCDQSLVNRVYWVKIGENGISGINGYVPAYVREACAEYFTNKVNEIAKEVPQTELPKEESELDSAECHGMEEYSKDDLEKVKDKTKENEELAGREVKDDELVQDELKYKKNESRKRSKGLYLCNECHKTFTGSKANHPCKGGLIETIVSENEYFGRDIGVKGVFEVQYKLDGKTQNIRVIAYDEGDAKRYVEKIKVGSKVVKTRKIRESRVKEDKIPGGLGDNKKDSQWRDNFDVYVAELRQVYSELINNNEFIKQQEELHPGVNIKLSLKKSCLNFWATQAGWRHKKKKRTKELDWKATLVNAIDLNKVYYPRGDDIVSRNLTPKNTGEEYKWSVEER